MKEYLKRFTENIKIKMTSMVNDYDLGWLMQTPMYSISMKVSHDYTPRIPFGFWKNFATAENLDEVKEKLAKYLDPKGNYEYVSERGTLSTILTFVDKKHKPGKNPTHVGFYTHFRISLGISKGSLLEQEVVIDVDEIVVGGD